MRKSKWEGKKNWKLRNNFQTMNTKVGYHFAMIIVHDMWNINWGDKKNWLMYWHRMRTQWQADNVFRHNRRVKLHVSDGIKGHFIREYHCEYKANGNWLKFYRCCWQVLRLLFLFFLSLFLLQANGFECSDRHTFTLTHIHIKFILCSCCWCFVSNHIKSQDITRLSQLIVQWTNSLNLTFIVCTSYIQLSATLLNFKRNFTITTLNREWTKIK